MPLYKSKKTIAGYCAHCSTTSPQLSGFVDSSLGTLRAPARLLDSDGFVLFLVAGSLDLAFSFTVNWLGKTDVLGDNLTFAKGCWQRC